MNTISGSFYMVLRNLKVRIPGIMYSKMRPVLTEIIIETRTVWYQKEL